MVEVLILVAGFVLGSSVSWLMIKSNEDELRRKLRQANQDFWHLEELLIEAQRRNKRYSEMVDTYQGYVKKLTNNNKSKRV